MLFFAVFYQRGFAALLPSLLFRRLVAEGYVLSANKWTFVGPQGKARQRTSG